MRRQLVVTAVVVAALVGEWIGHTLSFLRLGGGAALGGAVHGYMVPVGLALLAAAVAGAALWLRLWVYLGLRLDDAARTVRSVLRGTPLRHPPTPPRPSPSAVSRLAALALCLAVLQAAVYLVQENVERVVAGAGLSAAPLIGDHAAGALIQTAVAILMAAALVAAARLLGGRRRRLSALERLIAALSRRRRRPSSIRTPHLGHVVAARLLLGSALWHRPPPAVVTA